MVSACRQGTLRRLTSAQCDPSHCCVLNRQVSADGFCMQTGNTEETDQMPSLIRVDTTLLILS